MASTAIVIGRGLFKEMSQRVRRQRRRLPAR
jgi:hypothetical protein